MTKPSPPNTLMIVLPTPWQDDFYPRLSSTYLEIWDEELLGEGDDNTGELWVTGERGIRKANWIKDPKIDHLIDSITHTHPPFAETELLIADQHQCSWRLFVESASYDDARFLVRLIAAMSGTQSVATLIPSTGRAFPPTFSRQLSASDEIESVVSFFIHARSDKTSMQTEGLTAFGLPEIRTNVLNGKNEAYFNLLDLCASILLDGMPDLSREMEFGMQNYRLEKSNSRTPNPDNPVSGFYGVLNLKRT